MSQLEQIITLVNNWHKQKQDRLSWDEYFMATAFLISSRSPDQRLKVGCVLVKNNHIISLGYNGFLPSLPHESYIENSHELATVHSEQNCIADCAKRGVATEGASAYITHYPCINCFKILAAAGIQTIYYQEDYRNHKLVHILAHRARIQIIKLERYLPRNYLQQETHSLRGLPKIKSQPKLSFFDDVSLVGSLTDDEN